MNFKKYFLDKKVRYLIIGGWNAIFSYGATVLIFFLLTPYMNILVISIITNILAITMSFSTNKLFVFQDNGKWLKQYIRSYILYGGNIIFGIFGLWILSGIFMVPVWIAQALLVGIGVVIVFFGHKNFTFKKI